MTLCSLYFKSIFAVAWGILIEIKVKGTTRHSAGLAVIQGCCAIRISYITLFHILFLSCLADCSCAGGITLRRFQEWCWPGARGTAHIWALFHLEAVLCTHTALGIFSQTHRFQFPAAETENPSVPVLFIFSTAWPWSLSTKMGWGICSRCWGPVEWVSGFEQLWTRGLAHWKITLCQNTFCFGLLWQ